MCGIYITNIPYKREDIKSKLEKINYRGPDYTGILKDGVITLGHVRLAILDLDARSNQPYQFKNFTIVFNGEIYNFRDIRKNLVEKGYIFETTSDTEVLIKGYDAWGAGILDKLNGMFAFVIYDSYKEEIFAARDRLGVKPFYYYWKDGKFEICSQLQPLINSESKISNDAVSIYLSTGYVPSPYSILENVWKLRPGHILRIDLKKRTKTIAKYWDLNKVELLDISYEEAKEQLENLLKDAIKIRLQADVPLGTFLSGGIDSALVTAIASEISDQQIKTFTIGFDDPKFDESGIAEKFSEILGTDHTTTFCKSSDVLELIPKLVEVYGEPFADSSSLPSLLLNKVTKQHVTVALSGDGGDESFLGYNHFSSVEKFNRLKKVPFVVRRFISALLPHQLKLKQIISIEDEKDFIIRIFMGDQKLLKKKSTTWIDKYYSNFQFLARNSLQKAADLNIQLWLENDSNVKVDRASMAYSIEVRSPFLDYRIIEFARKLPVHYRYSSGKTKLILRDILAKYIPEEIFTQPKRGFALPIGFWLRTVLKEDFFQTVDDTFLSSLPNLDIKETNAIIRKFFANEDSQDIVYIWKLYILKKWINIFNGEK